MHKILHTETIMWFCQWYKNRSLLRPRRYHLRYRVSAPKQAAGHWLLLPYPTTTDYQTVEGVELAGPGTASQHDYFYAIQSPDWAEVQCTVTVQPRHYNTAVATKMTVADYAQHYSDTAYCLPDHWIQSNHPVIQQRAGALLAKQPAVIPLLKALYEHTLTTLTYGDPIPGLYSTQDALERSGVDCGGFVTYLAALCRSCRIPTRLVSGFWAGHTPNAMHAWLECLLPNGIWLAMDPSVDWLRQRGRSKSLGGFNLIGSDRIVMNTGSDHRIQVQGQELTLGIVQTPLLIGPTGGIEYVRDYHLETQ
jgi:transglutaminase-like putative cysteine protease